MVTQIPTDAYTYINNNTKLLLIEYLLHKKTNKKKHTSIICNITDEQHD